MLFNLDHIVHVTKDPAQAVKDMQSLGFNAFIGGKHANWGTRNGLSYFGLTYIEFLGIEHKHVAKTVIDNTLIRQLVAEPDNGLARLALRVNDIDEAARHFKKLGLRVTGPIPGSRRQPDGKLLEWAMLFIDDGKDPFRLPFIIDWKQSDVEREQQLVERGLIKDHPIVGVTLVNVVLATNNLKRSVHEWETLFGAVKEESFVDETLNAHCTRLILDTQSFMFCEPLGAGPIGDYLKQHGERPYRLQFSNTGENKTIHFHGGVYLFR